MIITQLLFEAPDLLSFSCSPILLSPGTVASNFFTFISTKIVSITKCLNVTAC